MLPYRLWCLLVAYQRNHSVHSHLQLMLSRNDSLDVQESAKEQEQLLSESTSRIASLEAEAVAREEVVSQLRTEVELTSERVRSYTITRLSLPCKHPCVFESKQ